MDPLPTRAKKVRIKRLLHVGTLALALIVSMYILNLDLPSQLSQTVEQEAQNPAAIIDDTTTITYSRANEGLQALAVKGRASKTGYSRSQFGDGWAGTTTCNTRNQILVRDLINTQRGEGCIVLTGTLNDPYTRRVIVFTRGESTSDVVQIDHVVALSDAWQKGAQQLAPQLRRQLANDPLNLLAVDGNVNQKKGDGDAATWLPPNKYFRCDYIARQISVKLKYSLWVTAAEKAAMQTILDSCPAQQLYTG